MNCNYVNQGNEKPLLKVIVENEVIDFELDTGSALTCIIIYLYTNLFTDREDLELKPTRTRIRVANGSTASNVSVCEVDISFRLAKYCKAQLYVIDGPFPALVGRDWISLFWGPHWIRNMIGKTVAGKGSTGSVQYVTVGKVARQDPVQDYCAENRAAQQISELPKKRLSNRATMRTQVMLCYLIRAIFVRSVPYAMKEKIEVTLDKMTKDRILEPIDSSDYASPIVPVEKEDGTVRICDDYKATLNPNILTKHYPLPTIEECLHPLMDGQKFSKLDIRQAYNNVKLRESDQKLTTANTSKGLFVWTRLPYGISLSTAIFQQTMDRVLQGLDCVVCRVDDILVTGKDDATHLDNIEQFIQRLEKAGFRCNLRKTKFLEDEVTYLGYHINKNGVRPCEGKVET